MPQTTTVKLRDGQTLVLQGQLTPAQIAAKVATYKQKSGAASTPPVSRFALGTTSIGASDPMAATVRRLARYLPTAGMFGGGAVGSLATGGNPAGEIAGAGVGATAGDLMRQMFQNPTERPTAGPAMQEGLYAGGGTALGSAVLRGLPAMFRKELRPDVARQLGILEREKIPYSAGDVNPQGGLQQIENFARGTLLGGTPMARFERGQRQGLFAYRQKVLDTIGPFAEREEVGKLLNTTIENRHEALMGRGGVFEKAYQKVASLYPAGVDTAQIRKEVAPIKAELDALLAEGRVGAAAKSTESPSRFYTLVDNLSKYGTAEAPAAPTILGPNGQPIIRPSRVNVPLNYKQVWEDKQGIDATIRAMGYDDPLRTKAKALAERLRGILDRAMETTAQQSSPQASQMIRKINAGYAKAKRLFETESLVADIGNMDSAQVVDKFFKGTATQPSKDLANALAANPGVKPILARRVVDNLMERISKNIEDVEVTPGATLERLLGANRSKLRTVLSNEQLSALDEFTDAAYRAQASGRMMNPASGRQMLAAGQLAAVGSTLASIATGNFEFAIGSATFVVAPEILAKALTNPKLARLLAKGFTIRPGTALAGKWIIQTANAIRSISTGEEPPDVQSYGNTSL